VPPTICTGSTAAGVPGGAKWYRAASVPRARSRNKDASRWLA